MYNAVKRRHSSTRVKFSRAQNRHVTNSTYTQIEETVVISSLDDGPNVDVLHTADLCGTCHKGQGKRSARWVQCGECKSWYHISCAGVSVHQYENLEAMKENADWTCKVCKNRDKKETNHFRGNGTRQ